MSDRCRFTTAYRFVDQERLVFAYTCDPVAFRHQLQHKFRARFSLQAFYRGRLLPGLRDRFKDLCHGISRNGCFKLTSDLADYLEDLPQVYTVAPSRKHARRQVRVGKHAMVYERSLEDLPDQAALRFVAAVVGVSWSTLRFWMDQGLPHTRKGVRILIGREELRYWLRANNKLTS